MSFFLSRYTPYFVFLLCMQTSLVYAVEESLLLAAQQMLNSGQSVEAYDLLDPHEEEYAGEKEYDYLYGLALLDTGEAANAVFAFQRVIAIEPNFAGARLELARAYFDMGQMQRSQREFRLLQNQSPPKSVSDVIDKYLAAIESRNLQNRKGWRGFLQLGMGDDSNVNNATTADSFLGFDLSDESRETPSSVISTLGGVSYDLPLTFDSKLFFKTSIYHRANNDASFTSTLNYDLLMGYNVSLSARGELSLAVQGYSADVDGEFNNKGQNLTGQYNFNFSSSNQVGLFARAGNIDYASAFDTKDVEQAVFGLSWAHVFSGQSRISLVVSAIGGMDEAVDPESIFSRDFNGLRLSMAYPVSHRFNFFLSTGISDSDYDGIFFDYPEPRSDSLSDVSFGGSWRVNKTWVIRAVIGQTENTSNVEIYEYDKSLIMLTARSEFFP